jgi:hypothetical protein
MSPTYEDLQDQLIEWLRPMRFTILDVTREDFESSMTKQIEAIIPKERSLLLIVALSNPSLCNSADAEAYIDATDIISDSIYRNLYKFAWQWFNETNKDMRELYVKAV